MEDRASEQLRAPLHQRDSRGWWTYHRWLIACNADPALTARAALAMARTGRIGFERDGKYWVQ